MIIVFLIVYGLALGSFVNALVWRIREQQLASDKAHGKKKPKGVPTKDRSILKGRSMCPHCEHQLTASDLIPVLSWVWLRGKCRYCAKTISAQYPTVELATAALFVGSYVYWPLAIHGAQIAAFTLWLLLLVGFMALVVYDLRWFLLPNRIVYPLSFITGLMAAVEVAGAPHPGKALLDTVLAVIVGGGIFYALFQVSQGKWIGGGDVKLGWLLGLAVGAPGKSLLFIFLAALGGSFIALPLLTTGKLKRNTVIPFGPFLIAAAIVTKLFGTSILYWYQHTLLML
jgi:prepilin signal peptidase PulO-like enzyme (type II secretory pathway)